MYNVDFDAPNFCTDGAMATTAASRRDEEAEEKMMER